MLARQSYLIQARIEFVVPNGGGIKPQDIEYGQVDASDVFTDIRQVGGVEESLVGQLQGSSHGPLTGGTKEWTRNRVVTGR